MPDVSIIVPVYNGEKYLPRCIDSILIQSYNDFELIVVDDGSSDGSPSICDAYARKDTRVRVIHQSHRGVSSACNRGIADAGGQYLMFCDGDDYAEPDWVETLYHAIERCPSDFVFSAFYMDEGGSSRAVRLSGGDYPGRIPAEEYFDIYQKGFSAYRWNRVYRSELVKGQIRFDEEVSIGEDVLFNIEYLKRCFA